jgi:hypothetical protein
VADVWGGLRVINVSDPRNPYEVGYHTASRYPSVENVVVAGNLVYAAEGDDGLRIVEFLGGGVAETPKPQVLSRTPQATVVRGVLVMPAANGEGRVANGACLLDAAGRGVMELQAGSNDVRRLAPGVYFVREEPQAPGPKPQATRKVVIVQ